MILSQKSQLNISLRWLFRMENLIKYLKFQERRRLMKLKNPNLSNLLLNRQKTSLSLKLEPSDFQKNNRKDKVSLLLRVKVKTDRITFPRSSNPKMKKAVYFDSKQLQMILSRLRIVRTCCPLKKTYLHNSSPKIQSNKSKTWLIMMKAAKI